MKLKSDTQKLNINDPSIREGASNAQTAGAQSEYQSVE